VTPGRWLALVVASALVAGCAPTSAYVSARKAEETAAVTLQASYATWRDYDRAHQEQIVAAAADLATAKQQLGQYRSSTQTKVDEAFIAARQSVSAFDNLLSAAGATLVKDYTTAITELLGAMATLSGVLAQYGVTLPAIPAAAKPTALRLWRLAGAVIGLASAEVSHGY
jgi:hypothetical protein